MVVAAHEFPIGEGYGLLFPFAEMRSGKGARLEGIGVTPHVEADLPEDDETLLASL